MSYSMNLSDILPLLSVDQSSEPNNLIVTSLAIDSRRLERGALFFAYPGVHSDGRDHILAAQQAGASAIVYEAGFDLPVDITVPTFAVSGVQGRVGVVANQFYEEPSSELQVFGVTGTNGKTTCCYLLTQA